MAATLLLVGALVLAGCLGGRDARPREEVAPHSTLEQTLVRGGDGTIEGNVVNENGAWLRGASAALLTTPFHATSDAKGAFRFTNLSAGSYTLRVDLDGYESLESPVTLDAGTTAVVVATLLAPDGRGLGFREHAHDFWGTETSMKLLDATIPQRSSILQGGEGTPYACVGTTIGVNPQNDVQGCYTLAVRLSEGTIVPPGTSTLRVTVAWDDQSHVPAVQMRYSPANTTNTKGLAFTSGQTQAIPVRGAMTDNGHARWTAWTFTIFQTPLYANGVVVASSDATNGRFVGDYHVRIVAEKGVLYPEPGHERFWADGDRIVLADNLQLNVSGVPTPRTRDPQATACGSSVCFVLSKNKIVPPGTTRLDVTLRYEASNPAFAPFMAEKTLAFRTGERSPGTATLSNLRVDPVAERSTGRVTYHLKLAPVETDSFYQTKSFWLFLVSKAGQERADSYTPDCIEVACGRDMFGLHVEAVNENFAADQAAGRI